VRLSITTADLCQNFWLFKSLLHPTAEKPSEYAEETSVLPEMKIPFVEQEESVN